MKLKDTGLTAQDIQDKVNKYMIETYERFDFLAETAKDMYLYDENKTPYLDFYAGIAVNNAGSCNEKVVAAVKDQVGDIMHTFNYPYTIPQALLAEKELPIDIKDSTIYYMGPSPAREGRPIGSAGPTTASRMDKYAPTLLDLGEKAMIGKGKRTKEVIDAIVRNHAVYFAAIGGAGALLSKCITKSEVVAYDDLGTEAIRKLQVENFPVIVVIDSEGNNLYESAIKEYCTYKNE